MTLRRMMCCGMVEISGLSDYRELSEPILIRDIAECHSPSKQVYYRRGFAAERPDEPRTRSYRLILFSEAVRPGREPNGYGQRLADLIQSKGLGTVTVMSDWGLNPNSGNRIKVWAWEIDHKAFWLEYAESWKREKYSSIIHQYWTECANKDARSLAALKNSNFRRTECSV